MSAAAIMSGISLGMRLIQEIVQMVQNGASDDEIRARLADPTGVAQDLISKLRETENKIDDYINKG